MMLTQYQLNLTTPGRQLINITDHINELVAKAGGAVGLCHVFIHHTSASLVICEKADPLVQRDLEAFMSRCVPDADPLYLHVDEGADDMPSHIRTILTQSFLVIPIINNQLALGTWQGIYLWEHRLRSHQRKITVTVQGA